MNGSIWRQATIMTGRVMKRSGFLCGLSALIGVLLMAGCAHDQTAAAKKSVDLRDLVRKEVSDPVRAQQILALMEQVEAGINFQKMINQDTQKQFMRLNADYNTTPEQIQGLLDGTKESREKNRQKTLDAFFQIQALTTPQEWEVISKAEIQKYPDFLKIIETPDKK